MKYWPLIISVGLNLKMNTLVYDNKDQQGPGNDFYLGGSDTKKKNIFCEFSKFLLYKSLILGGVGPPQTPPVPWPLQMRLHMSDFVILKHRCTGAREPEGSGGVRPLLELEIYIVKISKIRKIYIFS